jgi:hypothetical protein
VIIWVPDQSSFGIAKTCPVGELSRIKKPILQPEFLFQFQMVKLCWSRLATGWIQTSFRTIWKPGHVCKFKQVHACSWPDYRACQKHPKNVAQSNFSLFPDTDYLPSSSITTPATPGNLMAQSMPPSLLQAQTGSNGTGNGEAVEALSKTCTTLQIQVSLFKGYWLDHMPVFIKHGELNQYI